MVVIEPPTMVSLSDLVEPRSTNIRGLGTSMTAYNSVNEFGINIESKTR